MKNSAYLAPRTTGEPEATGETTMPTGGAACVRSTAFREREKLRAMLSRLSVQSIYLRFHLPYPRVPDWALDVLAGAELRGGQSLVAVAGGEVVGHAMYVRWDADSEAEMAVVVEDAWQSRGIGKLIVAELAKRARRRGVDIFTAEVRGENQRMLTLLRSMFGDLDSKISDGSYHVRVPLWALGPVSELHYPNVLRRVSS
jgi:GNAT superfamily N-acetyltransferase